MIKISSMWCPQIDCLDLQKQPLGLRDCHDQLVAWVKTFAVEDANSPEWSPRLNGLTANQSRRVGFLVEVTDMFSRGKVHPSWFEFVKRVQPLVVDLPWEPLWACDPEPNECDQLAASWHLTRGARFDAMDAICKYGDF